MLPFGVASFFPRPPSMPIAQATNHRNPLFQAHDPISQGFLATRKRTSDRANLICSCILAISFIMAGKSRCHYSLPFEVPNRVDCGLQYISSHIFPSSKSCFISHLLQHVSDTSHLIGGRETHGCSEMPAPRFSR